VSASPVAEEAGRLLTALDGWLRERGLVGASVHAVADHVGGSAECALCPLCQGLALLRGTSPEVWEHLRAAAASVAAAAVALVESGTTARERPRVQHIDIS